jgi:hypothetical protein
MPNYVATRISLVKAAAAVQQGLHDFRITTPDYLRRAPDADVYIYKNGKAAGAALWQDDKHRQIMKDGLRGLVMDDIRQQQAIYKAKNPRQGLRADAHWMIDGVITFTSAGIKDISDADLLDRCRKAVEAQATALGVKAVYVVIHKDEKTRHAHYALENVNRETGKTIGRTIKKRTCRQMQDLIAEQFSDWGLQRGEDKTVSGAEHKSVSESHRIELEKQKAEIAALQTRHDALQAACLRQKGILDQQAQAIKEAEPIMAEIRALKQDFADRKEQTRQWLKAISRQALCCIFRAEDRNGRWTMGLLNNKRPTITRPQNVENILTELYKKPDARTWHVNFYGLPPVFCLDDVTPEAIQQMHKDGLTPTATIQTSRDKADGAVYQVWLSFAGMDDYPKQMIKRDRWQVVSDYLIKRYGADPRAAEPAHTFRVPGFRRHDDPDWIAQTIQTSNKDNDFSVIKDVIADHTQDWTKAQADIKNYKSEVPDIDDGVVVPDWFLERWIRLHQQYAADKRFCPKTSTGAIDYSEIDYRCTKDIIRRAQSDPEKKLRYIQYALHALTVEAADRHKSKTYARDTVDAVLGGLAMEH